MNKKIKLVSLVSIILLVVIGFSSCFLGLPYFPSSHSRRGTYTDENGKLVWEYYSIYRVDSEDSIVCVASDSNSSTPIITIAELGVPAARDGYYFYGWSLDKSCIESDFFEKNNLDELHKKTEVKATDKLTVFLNNVKDKGTKEVIKDTKTYAEISYKFYFYPVWIPYDVLFEPRAYKINDKTNLIERAYEVSDEEGLYWGLDIVYGGYGEIEFDELVFPSQIKGKTINYLSTDYTAGFPKTKKLYLPSTIEYISPLFYLVHADRCSSVEIDENNPYYKAVDNVIYSKDMKTLFYIPTNKDFSNWTMPSSVENIATRAFQDKPIVSFDFTSIKTLNYKSFASSNLVEVNIPSTVSFGSDYIEEYTPGNIFEDCNKLKKVVINSENIPYDMFRSCIELDDVTIGKNVKNIYNYAFFENDKLTQVKYMGTKEEWSGVNKAPCWFGYGKTITIKCSDGDIEESTKPIV